MSRAGKAPLSALLMSDTVIKSAKKSWLTILDAHMVISVVPVFVRLNLQFPPGRLKDSHEPTGIEKVSLLINLSGF